MILCARASQNIHLTYSVIKFLRYEQFVWQGDSLPFQAYSLGDLTLAEITLFDSNGSRQSGLQWERGQIFGNFQAGQTYDLNLRLEYRAPFNLDEIRCDFESLHPYAYEMTVDFSEGFMQRKDAQLELAIGDFSKAYDVRNQKETTESGHEVVLSKDSSDLGFSISHQTNIPFGHSHFPRVFLNPSSKPAKNGLAFLGRSRKS